MASLVEVCINGGYYSYKLDGPYSLKSGKKEGSSVEGLMFSNISYLHQLKHIRDFKLRPGSQPDRLHMHLAWILSAGEFVKTTEGCRYCPNERRAIRLFSVRWSGGACSYGHPYTCCENASCSRGLLEERSSLLPLKFSSLSSFRNTEQKRVGAFFKEIFLGSGRLDPEKAFQLFLSATSNAVQL